MAMTFSSISISSNSANASWFLINLVWGCFYSKRLYWNMTDDGLILYLQKDRLRGKRLVIAQSGKLAAGLEV